MNKLITSGFTGGFPYELDDIRWNDEAYRDVFTSILKGFSTGSTDNLNFIIQGCVPTYNAAPYQPINLTSGYIMLNGEVLKVDAHIGNTSTATHYQKAVSYNPDGIKISKDGNYTGSTYQMNRAVLSGTSGNLRYTDHRFSDIIKNVVNLSSINSQISDLTTKVNDLLSFSGITYNELYMMGDNVASLNSKTSRMLEVLYIGEVKCDSTSQGNFNIPPYISPVYNPNNYSPTINRISAGYYDIDIKQPVEVINNSNIEVSFLTLSNYTQTVAVKQCNIINISDTYGFNVTCSDDLTGNDCLFRFTIYRRPIIN